MTLPRTDLRKLSNLERPIFTNSLSVKIIYHHIYIQLNI